MPKETVGSKGHKNIDYNITNINTQRGQVNITSDS